MRAWQGDWDGAFVDAREVPTGFVYEAIFSGNTDRERNDLWYETHTRLDEHLLRGELQVLRVDCRRPGHNAVECRGSQPPVFRQRFVPRSPERAVGTGDSIAGQAVEKGAVETLIGLDDDYILENGGNGALEIRNFICAMGAMSGLRGEIRGRVIAYEPMPSLITGLGFTELKAV